MKEACTLGANGWAVSDRSAHKNFGMTRGRQGSPQAAERAIIILKSDRERATESVTACHCRCTPDIMVLSQARYQQAASYRRKSRYTELSDIRQSRVLCFRGARDSSALCEKFRNAAPHLTSQYRVQKSPWTKDGHVGKHPRGQLELNLKGANRMRTIVTRRLPHRA